ncbi:ubiquitin-like superfamily protein isoform X1 [Carex rostrata]
MEKPTEALVYKGSIIEAINEARSQKKLFVVYISGEDENSILLGQSTWVDQNVHEMIKRCCIFLHLIQGSIDASQFSAIYPQNSVPSISAIGHNGVLMWYHEGYISAENLRENIEKSITTLHLQETAAALLTAALATQNPTAVSVASAANLSTEGGSTMSDTPSPSSSTEAKNSDLIPTTSSDKMVDGSNSELSRDQKAAVPSEEECQKRDEVKVVSISKEAPSEALKHGAMKEKVESSATTSSEVKTKSAEITKKDAVKLDEVHLNIRMPNGTSLQIKLVKSDALRSVKKFVDEQQDIQANSYNLAVPYPRKLFSEEDMVRTLSELGFASRETLIVVPHQSTRSLRPQPASNNHINTSQDTSNGNDSGYFGYLRRVLSYVNPFSYLGANMISANSNPSTNNQNPLTGEGASQASQSSVNTRQHITSRSFASNIHTLRHDEGTDPPRDRNTFWNGNSTQFGSSDQQ